MPRKNKGVFKSALKSLTNAVKNFNKGFNGGGIQGAFNKFGSILSNQVNYKNDTNRRELSKEISIQAAKLNYTATRLEKIAETQTGVVADEYNNRARELRELSGKLEEPEMLRGFLGGKDIKSSNSEEYLSKFREQLKTVKAEMSDDELQQLRKGANLTLQTEKQKKKDPNAAFRYQARIGADEGVTSLFGKGETAHARVVQFFNYYKRDWQGVEGDRYEAIQAAHGGKTLTELYEEMMKDTADNMSWRLYVVKWLGEDVTNVNTTDPVWQAHVDSEFAALDSPTQAEISAGWATMQ